MKVAAVKAQGAPDKLVIETRPDPVAGKGEILVRVRASSLNFHDLAVVYGMIHHRRPHPDVRWRGRGCCRG